MTAWRPNGTLAWRFYSQQFCVREIVWSGSTPRPRCGRIRSCLVGAVGLGTVVSDWQLAQRNCGAFEVYARGALALTPSHRRQLFATHRVPSGTNHTAKKSPAPWQGLELRGIQTHGTQSQSYMCQLDAALLRLTKCRSMARCKLHAERRAKQARPQFSYRSAASSYRFRIYRDCAASAVHNNRV
jgi:hypothetical protein